MSHPEQDPQAEILRFDMDGGIANWDKDWFPSLGDINARLVETYGFADHDRHFHFLAEAAFIIQGYSSIRIAGRHVTVPSDMPTFKEAAAKFQKAMQKVDELSEAVFDIRSNATADTLLFHFDPERETLKLMKLLARAMSILVEIEKYEGKVGNRAAPDWVEDFCIHCQRFWHDERGGGTRIIFEAERRTKITPWVEDVYVSLAQRLNVEIPLSRVKGVARNVPAYRADAEPNKGDTC
ncbi:MAG: hypothetical protein AAF183_06385 [Pseudomonadota bacterium]